MVLELAVLHSVVITSHTNVCAKGVNSLSSVSTTTQAVDGRDARIIPSTHSAVHDELENLALGKLHMGDVQASKLPHVRAPDVKLLEYPVVEIAADLRERKEEGRKKRIEGDKVERKTVREKPKGCDGKSQLPSSFPFSPPISTHTHTL